MTSRAPGPRPARSTRLGALLVGATLVLAGCSSSGDGEQAGSQETSPAASPSETTEPYLDVPDGVELTGPGSELDVGEVATLAWHPTQQKIGALRVKVTRLEKAGFQPFQRFKIDKQTRQRQPYFVTARVANVGETNLSGTRVPLYVLGDADKLVPASTFQGTFQPCPSTPLPKKFTPGSRTTVCLVYLVPDKGDLSGVVFRPNEDFTPITWTGDVTAFGQRGQGNQGGSGGGQDGQGGSGGGQDGSNGQGGQGDSGDGQG